MKKKIIQWLETVFRADIIIQNNSAILKNKVIGEVSGGTVALYKPIKKNFILRWFKAEKIICITYYKGESCSV